MKKVTIFYLTIMVLFSSTMQLLSQNLADKEYTIKSSVFDGERKIKFYYPKDKLPEKYLMTFVLDAQDLVFWNAVKGNVDYLTQSGEIIPIVLIGLELENRNEELGTLSHKLKEHLINELLPFIKSKYHNIPILGILGHSSGGGFVIDLFSQNKNTLFDVFFAISPTFDYLNFNEIKNRLSLNLQSKQNLGKTVYTSSGNIGSIENEVYSNVKILDSLVHSHSKKSLFWNFEHFKNKGHWSSTILSINNGFVEVSRNYRIDLKILEDFDLNKISISQQINDFHKQKEELLGVCFYPDHNFIRYASSNFADMKKYKTAKELIEWNIQKEPNNFKLYMGLSQLYEKMGSNSKALISYEKTLKVLEVQKDIYDLGFYKRKVEWLKNKIEKLSNQ